VRTGKLRRLLLLPGVSSVDMTEATYTRLIFELTLSSDAPKWYRVRQAEPLLLNLFRVLFRGALYG